MVGLLYRSLQKYISLTVVDIHFGVTVGHKKYVIEQKNQS